MEFRLRAFDLHLVWTQKAFQTLLEIMRATNVLRAFNWWQRFLCFFFAFMILYIVTTSMKVMCWQEKSKKEILKDSWKSRCEYYILCGFYAPSFALRVRVCSWWYFSVPQRNYVFVFNVETKYLGGFFTNSRRPLLWFQDIVQWNRAGKERKNERFGADSNLPYNAKSARFSGGLRHHHQFNKYVNIYGDIPTQTSWFLTLLQYLGMSLRLIQCARESNYKY